MPLKPVILIPARMGSTRFPAKVLADIAGVPMIVQVWRRAKEAKVGRVVVAAAEPVIVALPARAGTVTQVTPFLVLVMALASTVVQAVLAAVKVTCASPLMLSVLPEEATNVATWSTVPSGVPVSSTAKLTVSNPVKVWDPAINVAAALIVSVAESAVPSVAIDDVEFESAAVTVSAYPVAALVTVKVSDPPLFVPPA